MVLPGHPDKFCDQVADAIVQACYAVDPRGLLPGRDELLVRRGLPHRRHRDARPLQQSLEDIVRETGRAIGYVAGQRDRRGALPGPQQRVPAIRPRPAQWTRHVNDQCIAIGWAGYDAQVAFLPPEHFLAHVFREALTQSCQSGRLQRQGPDGKLIVRLRENSADWVLEHVLVTLQHLRRNLHHGGERCRGRGAARRLHSAARARPALGREVGGHRAAGQPQRPAAQRRQRRRQRPDRAQARDGLLRPARARSAAARCRARTSPTSTAPRPMRCARPRSTPCAAARRNAWSPACGRPTSASRSTSSGSWTGAARGCRTRGSGMRKWWGGRTSGW